MHESPNVEVPVAAADEAVTLDCTIVLKVVDAGDVVSTLDDEDTTTLVAAAALDVAATTEVELVAEPRDVPTG